MEVTDPEPLYISSTSLQQSIFVNGGVQKRSVSLLIDTGSAVTIVHKRVWCPRQQNLQKVNRPVIAANGEPLSILGQAEVCLEIAGREFLHQVLIAGDITQECILGADFLTTHGFVIDLGNRLLRVGETSAPLFSSKTPLASSYHVSVGETFVIHPGEERLCKANISDEYPFLAGTLGVVEVQDGVKRNIRSSWLMCWLPLIKELFH